MHLRLGGLPVYIYLSDCVMEYTYISNHKPCCQMNPFQRLNTKFHVNTLFSTVYINTYICHELHQVTCIQVGVWFGIMKLFVTRIRPDSDGVCERPTPTVWIIYFRGLRLLQTYFVASMRRSVIIRIKERELVPFQLAVGQRRVSFCCCKKWTKLHMRLALMEPSDLHT